jgi:hypothetical protein
LEVERDPAGNPKQSRISTSLRKKTSALTWLLAQTHISKLEWISARRKKLWLEDNIYKPLQMLSYPSFLSGSSPSITFFGTAARSKFSASVLNPLATSGPERGFPCPGATVLGFKLDSFRMEDFADSQSDVK